MAHEKLLWHTEGPGCDYADYRGLRLRKKTICPKGDGLAIRKVFIGFTGVGVVIRSLAVPGHTGRAHKIEAGKHPGDWFKPQTDTYPSLNAAIDTFVDMVLNHQDDLKEKPR